MKKNLLTTAVVAAIVGVSSIANAATVDTKNFVEEYKVFTNYTASDSISRAEVAKVLVEFLKKTEGETAFADRADHTYKCSFSDVSKLNAAELEYVKLSCSHGLFKGHNGKFNPGEKLTWAQALALLARIDNAKIAEGNPWWANYQSHAVKQGWLKTKDIIKADQNITKEQFANLLINFANAENPVLANKLADTTWTLQSFDGKEVTGNYTLSFTTDRLNTNFCNVINGNYKVVDGDKLQGTLVQTEMACIDAEEKNTLESAFSIEGASFIVMENKSLVENKVNILKLTTKTGKEFIYTTKVAEAKAIVATNALTNTSWTLKEFNGKAVTGSYKMTVNENNHLSTKFCNNINGNITVDGNKLNGILISTIMACTDEEKNSLENKFNLEGATYLITSTKMVSNNIERLTITTKDGDTYSFLKETTNLQYFDGEYGFRTLNGDAITGSYLITFSNGTMSTKICNNINGNYTLESGVLKGTAISTLMACIDEEQAKLESKFNINNATVKMEGVDKLTLTTEKGDIFELVKIYR